MFIRFYSREDAEDAVKYISGTILDDRPIRVDFDWGFQEGRQWGRGRSGGQVSCCACNLLPNVYPFTCFNLVLFVQVRDEYRTDYDPDILLHFSLTISKVLQYVFYVMMVLIFLEVRRG